MSRDSRILGIRQTDLGETRTAGSTGKIVDATLRHESIDKNTSDIVARQFGFDRAPDQCGASARNRDRYFLEFRIHEKRFFRLPATVSQSGKLPGIQSFVLREMVGESEIHVVATEKNMVAD